MQTNPKKRRRVYYSTDEFYRVSRTAAALLNESLTEFVHLAILERIDAKFSAEQRQILFNSQTPA